MRDRQGWLPWLNIVLIISPGLLSGPCAGLASAPAPAPTAALVSTRSEWTDLHEVVTQNPVTESDLAVPETGVQLGIQLAGTDALATDDVMESIRSVLAQVLPVTYSDVDPQGYKNVTVCPATAPGMAPMPAKQGSGRPAAPGQPGSPGQNTGRRRLQGRRSLAQQSPDAVAVPATACENKMRAVFMLRRSLGTDRSIGNATYVQKTVKDSFYSGFMLSRAKRSKLNIVSMDLLVYQSGGTSGDIYPSSEAALGPGTAASSPSTAPAPSIQADAEWSIKHPAANGGNQTTDVFFTLILTGQDAVETNAGMIKQLSYLLTDILNTGNVDYLTDDNTAVVDEHQLPPITPGDPTPGRKLLARLEADEMDAELVPLSESERKAMSAWLKRGRHGKRGDRAVRADHAALRLRALLQAPQPMERPRPGQPPAGGPPIDPAQLVYSGPVNALSIAYRVANIAQPGPAVIAEKLGYFIQTGQATQLMQQAGYRIGNIELDSFSPLPGVPAPGPLGLGTAGAQSAAQAGTVNLKLVGKLVLGIVLPVSLLAIALAATFAYLFFKYKRRYADSEHPIKDSARSMDNSDRKSLPMSSGSGGMRSVSSNQRSGSGGIRGIMENLSRNDDVSGQEVLALASLAKRSLTLPGMQSDWEIDPDELEIAKRPDGSEWRLGTGASAHVYKAYRNGVQVVAVKIFTDQVPGANQLRYAEAFRREIFILRSCHDRNIVQFLGACLQVGQTILVQEYMENGDLFHAISEDMNCRFGWYRKKLPTGRPVPNTGMARRIALDTARGLFFLHSRKIVHFDLKSANVLLGRDWTAKIADVGLAKILKDGWLSTLREVGTFSWAAPEVLLGKPCTEKVDIYSYGVLLWELSAGEAPPGRNLRPLRVPEECPADVEAMIARCLDSAPEKRPSARELVEFMVQLPQQISLNGTGVESGSTELASSAGSNGLSDNILTHGASLPPMTPRPPPGGMVLPNAFGLMSMKSFKRSSSSKGTSAQESGNAQLSTPAGSSEAASAKPQKGGLSMPGSAFKSLKSMSFKRRASQGTLETTVEESSGSIDKELREAVDRSNNSFRGAAEGRRAVVSPVDALGAAPTVRGETAPHQPEAGSPRSVRFADGAASGPSFSNRPAELNGNGEAVSPGANCSTPALGRPMVRNAFTSRDSASEVQDAQTASTSERARQPMLPAARPSPSSAPASEEKGQAGSSPPKRAPPQKPWRLPFMSAFASEPKEASSSREEAPFSSSISAEPSPGSTASVAHAPGHQGKPGRMVPSAFAAAEPDGEERPDTEALASAQEQVPQRQQPRRPGVSAFAEGPPDQQHDSVQPKTRPFLDSTFASEDLAAGVPRQQQSTAAPVAPDQGSRSGAAEGIEMSDRGNTKQEPDIAAPEGRKPAPQLMKSPFHQEA